MRSVFFSGLAAVPMTLVFGCRSAESDHLYKEEVLEMKRRGVLGTISTAYSRQPSQAKVSSSWLRLMRLKYLVESPVFPESAVFPRQ